MAVITCNETHPTAGACTAPSVSYAGAVLDTYEDNGYDDSDFIAVVWDAAAGAVKKVCYASTRSWTYHNGAAVDATTEVRNAAIAAAAPVIAERRAAVVGVGVTVRSTTTRGKNVGVVGEVRWIGEGYRGRGVRLGVRVEGVTGLVYLDGARVEALTDEARLADMTNRVVQDLLLGRWSEAVR